MKSRTSVNVLKKKRKTRKGGVSRKKTRNTNKRYGKGRTTRKYRGGMGPLFFAPLVITGVSSIVTIGSTALYFTTGAMLDAYTSYKAGLNAPFTPPSPPPIPPPYFERLCNYISGILGEVGKGFYEFAIARFYMINDFVKNLTPNQLAHIYVAFILIALLIQAYLNSKKTEVGDSDDDDAEFKDAVGGPSDEFKDAEEEPSTPLLIKSPSNDSHSSAPLLIKPSTPGPDDDDDDPSIYTDSSGSRSSISSWSSSSGSSESESSERSSLSSLEFKPNLSSEENEYLKELIAKLQTEIQSISGKTDSLEKMVKDAAADKEKSLQKPLSNQLAYTKIKLEKIQKENSEKPEILSIFVDTRLLDRKRERFLYIIIKKFRPPTDSAGNIQDLGVDFFLIQAISLDADDVKEFKINDLRDSDEIKTEELRSAWINNNPLAIGDKFTFTCCSPEKKPKFGPGFGNKDYKFQVENRFGLNNISKRGNVVTMTTMRDDGDEKRMARELETGKRDDLENLVVNGLSKDVDVATELMNIQNEIAKVNPNLGVDVLRKLKSQKMI